VITKKSLVIGELVAPQLFFDPAAGTYQTAAGFVCPFGERQWLWVMNGVVMCLLPAFSSFRTTVFA
jgi:hypothetical protein